MGYSLCIVAIFGYFQNAFIFRILFFFSSRFCIENFNVFVETFFAYLRHFHFLTQTEYFAWAIACCVVATFGHFQNALNLRIIAFFGAVFVIEPLKCVCSNVFRMF